MTKKKLEEKDEFLEKEFDFKNAVKNPYAAELKKQITIKVSPSIIDYFKKQAKETGIPYQTLINLYLADCVKNEKKLEITWEKKAG
ncbi:MAG: BrnA antitoxin family protein [Clostridiales bacterium]|nr:BrnA antitoxin family protein [Clostridiales bacterium]